MTSFARLNLLSVVLLAVIATAATPASAQRSRQKDTPRPVQPADPAKPANPNQKDQDAKPASDTPSTDQDSQQAAPDPEDEAEEIVLEPTPYLELRNTKPWTLKGEVLILSYQDVPNSPVDLRELNITPMDFSSATVVFPVLVSTGSSQTRMIETEQGEIPAFEGEVRVNDVAPPQDMAFVSRGIDGERLPGNTWRAQWLVAKPDRSTFTNVRQIDLKFEVPVECSETVFDERRASEVDWPKGEWPPEALAALDNEAYIEFDPRQRNREYNNDPIDALLKTWLEGNDPKKLKPVVLAKWIAGNLLEHVQPNGNGLVTDRRTALVAGFDLQAVPVTLTEGRGSPHDMTNALLAMYRRVGLPARLVIGYDVGAAKEGKTIYDREKGGEEIRSWVEFCLYDEAGETLGWIPVDIVAMRERSSRMPPQYLQRPAQFFGSHDRLDEIIPIAHHYAPAKTSTWFYDYPAFWGWFVQPSPPIAGSQSVRFDANRTARRSNRR